MAHIYKTRNDYNINSNSTNSQINLTDDIQIEQARRVENILFNIRFKYLYIYNRHNHYLQFL